MYLIAGLGNPGTQYINTRHNAGFLFIDFLQTLLAAPTFKSQFHSKLTKIELGADQIVLLKPETFMNLSGPEIKHVVSYYHIETKHLLIVHDDLDIPLGKFKIDHAVGPELHNGVDSIESAFGTKDFHRIRIGVDNRNNDNSFPGEKYVLERFSAEEETVLLNTFPLILSLLKLEYHSIFPFFKRLSF